MSLIVCAICAAVVAISKILAAFRDTVTVEKVGVVVPPDGSFSSFHGSTFRSTQIWSISKISKVASTTLKKLDSMIPSAMPGKREEFGESLQDMVEFEGIGSSSVNYFASYNNNTGKLAFVSLNFDYVSDTQFMASYTYAVGNFSLPSSYEIFATTKKNLFRTVVTHSIQEIPPSLTDEDVVNALVMLIAPVLGGFTDVSSEFIDDLNSLSASYPDYAKGKSIFT